MLDYNIVGLFQECTILIYNLFPVRKKEERRNSDSESSLKHFLITEKCILVGNL